MKRVLSRGAQINIVVLAEFFSEHEAYACEDSFITRYSEMGHRLTNIAPGGLGGTPSATHLLPEFREMARIRAKEVSSTSEAIERSRLAAKKRWDAVPPEKRVAWNKGIKTSAPKPDKMVVGSKEFREHLRQTTKQYFEELKSDPERYANYLEDRARVAAGNSSGKKIEWANLSDEARKMRGRNMSMGKRFANAKRNGLALTIFPVVSGSVHWNCMNLDGKRRVSK
jgi:hypothetical protein